MLERKSRRQEKEEFGKQKTENRKQKLQNPSSTFLRGTVLVDRLSFENVVRNPAELLNSEFCFLNSVFKNSSSNKALNLAHRCFADEHQEQAGSSFTFEMPSIHVLEVVTNLDGAKCLLIDHENVKQLSAWQSKTGERELLPVPVHCLTSCSRKVQERSWEGRDARRIHIGQIGLGPREFRRDQIQIRRWRRAEHSQIRSLILLDQLGLRFALHVHGKQDLPAQDQDRR